MLKEFFDQLIIRHVKNETKGTVAKPSFHMMDTHICKQADYTTWVDNLLSDFQVFARGEYPQFILDEVAEYKIHRFYKVMYFERLCKHFAKIDAEGSGMLNFEQFNVVMKKMREDEARDMVVGCVYRPGATAASELVDQHFNLLDQFCDEGT